MLRGSNRWASHFKKLHSQNEKRQLFPFLAFSFATTNGAADNDESQRNRPSSPPPIQVGFTESAGRGVFATRRIGAGELIHTAKPIVCHPSVSSLHSVCYFCLKKIPNKAVSQIHDISFCSQECKTQSQDFHQIEKRADWSTFDKYCQMNGLKYPLLVKRFACLVISGSASASSLDILQPATLSCDMISLVEKEFCLLRSTFQDADLKAEQLAFLTKQWYTGVLVRIRINAFRVELACGSYENLLSSAAASVEAEGAVGNAVYMLPSFYNHDCDPNAHILWLESVDARVKALRDIEAGEELRICYIDASMDREARQNILAKGYGFQCNCLLCSSHHVTLYAWWGIYSRCPQLVGSYSVQHFYIPLYVNLNRNETLQLARENLEKEPRIMELRNQCRIIRTSELAAAQEKLHELERKKEETLKFYSPASLLHQLQEAMNKTEEESEALHRQLLDGEIDLSSFIQKYKKLRYIYHRRALTHLAAKTSLNG